MKVTGFLLCLLFFGCKSLDDPSNKKNQLLTGRVYEFSDSDVRYLKVYFEENGRVIVSNNVSGVQAPNYHKFNFTVVYSLKKIDPYRYIIGSPIGESKFSGTKKYVRPFRREAFQSRNDILPNVEGDTIFFNSRFNVMLLKDFPFTPMK